MTRKPVNVTDHAVLRYLERVLGFKIEKVRAHIGAKTQDAHRAGASAVIHGGFSYKIVNGHVVTVAPAKSTKRDGPK